MWTARLNLNGQLMSFSGRWTWDGVARPRQQFFSALTELEVTQFVRSMSRAQTQSSRSPSPAPQRIQAETRSSRTSQPNEIKPKWYCWYYHATIPSRREKLVLSLHFQLNAMTRKILDDAAEKINRQWIFLLRCMKKTPQTVRFINVAKKGSI